MRLPRAAVPLLLAVVAALATSACEDLREYSGLWSGTLSVDPHLAHGFPPGTVAVADVTSSSRTSIAFSLSISPGGPPMVAPPAPARPTIPFQPIQKAAGDVLAEVQLPGEPLRTFFGFVQPPGEAPLLTVVSLYPENRMEIRLIRGPDDAYGVFYMRRVLPGVPPP